LVYTPVPSVNYCDGLGRCFRLVCIYACAAVFFDATVFSVNKDLYYVGTAETQQNGGLDARHQLTALF